jgi:hypothetical protein
MTLKEYLRQSNPKLDKLAEQAEVQRTADEETVYENKIGGNHYDKI